jgi:hypothetical protein
MLYHPRFPLPVVDMSEVDKTKAGSEIFPTATQGKAAAAVSIPEEKYVYRCVASTAADCVCVCVCVMSCTVWYVI